jgi:hypothetical protein
MKSYCTMKTCCTIVIIFMLLFITCQSSYIEKKSKICPSSLLDNKSIQLQSKVLKPLPTYPRSAVQHLITGCDQEVSDL